MNMGKKIVVDLNTDKICQDCGTKGALKSGFCMECHLRRYKIKRLNKFEKRINKKGEVK